MIRIGYMFCRTEFEMKMWVGLPDLESENRGHLVKCGFISALLRHNWQIKIIFKAYNLMFPCMYCEMVTTVKLVNVSITTSCWVWWDHLWSTLLTNFKCTILFANQNCWKDWEKENQCLYVIGLERGRALCTTFPSNFNAQDQLRS